MTTIRTVWLWALCIFGVCNAAAQDRSFHWDSLTIAARLDAQGMLHVTERHAMVFDGAWNGGERSFQHNLAFPSRSGTIRQFDATLELDPVWRADGMPTRWHHENLQPGESVFVSGSLRYRGAHR